MKLAVLVDNNTTIDKNYFGEPGLSYYIEAEGKRLLFDVGYSDIFLRNACKMGIDLKKTDYLVLSHGHLDHTWGMVNLFGILDYYSVENASRATLLAHPGSLLPKTDKGEQIGFIYSHQMVESAFQVNLTKEPVWITEKLVFLGEIERANDFESNEPIGVTIENGEEVPDYLMDDTALAYKTREGIVVITGCSHSGICNIVEYAKKVCGDDRVLDIIGGFHLLKPSEARLKRTLAYMKKLSPREIHTCHCTDLASKISLAGVVNLKEVGVGDILSY